MILHITVCVLYVLLMQFMCTVRLLLRAFCTLFVLFVNYYVLFAHFFVLSVNYYLLFAYFLYCLLTTICLCLLYILFVLLIHAFAYFMYCSLTFVTVRILCIYEVYFMFCSYALHTVHVLTYSFCTNLQFMF